MFGTCGCYGNLSGPETDVRTGMPSGTKVVADIDIFDTSCHIEESLTVGSKYPRCGEESGGAKPLFDIGLLTGGGKYCILVSQTHPSVDRQKAMGAPGEEWVAEQVLCHGILYDNDFWEWAVHGKARLHVDDLLKYYPRHKAVIEKDKDRPKPTVPQATG